MRSGDFPATGTAIVVGANGGLGNAVSACLLDRGSNVVMTYRRSSETVLALAGERSATRGAGSGAQLDLTDADACGTLVAREAERWGGLHTLVYAAGPHVPWRHLSAMQPGEVRAQMEADTMAFLNVTLPALPLLRASGGSVVAITTAATHRFPARDALSSMPKAAVEAAVRAIAVEEGRFGIRANCVAPGMTQDGMVAASIADGDFDSAFFEVSKKVTPMRRFGTARDIAEAVCFLASARAGFISGQTLRVDGGYSV